MVLYYLPEYISRMKAPRIVEVNEFIQVQELQTPKPKVVNFYDQLIYNHHLD